MNQTATQHPTDDERVQFSISAYRGIEVGLGKTDPMAEIARKLEDQHPGHLVLVQVGKFLHGYDRTEAITSYHAALRHTGTTIHREIA